MNTEQMSMVEVAIELMKQKRTVAGLLPWVRQAVVLSNRLVPLKVKSKRAKAGQISLFIRAMSLNVLMLLSPISIYLKVL